MSKQIDLKRGILPFDKTYRLRGMELLRAGRLQRNEEREKAAAVKNEPKFMEAVIPLQLTEVYTSPPPPELPQTTIKQPPAIQAPSPKQTPAKAKK